THAVNGVGHVAGRQGAPQLGGDAALQPVVDLDALGGGDEQQQLPHPDAALGLVLEVHDEAVGHLGEPLHHRVELGRAEPHPAPVEGGVGPAGDHAAAVVVEGDPVAVAPHAGEVVEVGGPVA